MFYKIKKNSVSNYPNPTINNTVLCMLNETDTEENAVYWIPFQISLNECIDKTETEINDMIRAEGERLFSLPEYQVIYQSIEAGVNITAPEIL